MSEETNPVLELAKEMGYNPDFEGEGKKTPEEFIKHGTTIVKNQSGKIKDLMKTVGEMSESFSSMQKTFLETTEANAAKHKADLAKQRDMLETKLDNAVVEADTTEVKKIRKEIADIDKQSQAPSKKEVSDDQAYFNEWSKDKKWIESDKKTIAAFKIAQIEVLAEHGEGLGAEFELTEIDKKLKKKYPEKYGLKPEEDPPGGGPGEGNKASDKTTKEVKLSTLTHEEKAMFNSMKKAAGKQFNEKSTLSAIGKVRASKEK